MITWTSRQHAGQACDTMVIAPPKQAAAAAAVIVLHGLGDDSYGWQDEAQRLQLTFPVATRMVIPTAPSQSVSMFGGLPASSWYDIMGMRDRADEPCAGIDASLASITQLVDREVEAVGPENTFLLGFSQGAALALHVGLSYPRALGGVVALSGYFARPRGFVAHPDALNTPIQLHHGEADDVVRIDWGRDAHSFLQQLGVKTVDMYTYEDLGHWVSLVE